MKKTSTPLTPENWFETAFAILKAEGHHRVTLREMCGELGVSTGSFYHHFANRDEFVERLFDYWAELGRESIGSVIENGSPDTLNEINRKVNDLIDHRLEAAMRAWGLFDARVARKIVGVDELRRTFFRTFYGDRLDPVIARDIIDLHLCSLVGAQFMYMDHPRILGRFGGFVNRAAETLVESMTDRK